MEYFLFTCLGYENQRKCFFGVESREVRWTREYCSNGEDHSNKFKYAYAHTHIHTFDEGKNSNFGNIVELTVEYLETWGYYKNVIG